MKKIRFYAKNDRAAPSAAEAAGRGIGRRPERLSVCAACAKRGVMLSWKRKHHTTREAKGMSGYILDLRKTVGHRPLLQVGASVIVTDPAGRILLQLRRDCRC